MQNDPLKSISYESMPWIEFFFTHLQCTYCYIIDWVTVNSYSLFVSSLNLPDCCHDCTVFFWLLVVCFFNISFCFCSSQDSIKWCLLVQPGLGYCLVPCFVWKRSKEKVPCLDLETLLTYLILLRRASCLCSPPCPPPPLCCFFLIWCQFECGR